MKERLEKYKNTLVATIDFKIVKLNDIVYIEEDDENYWQFILNDNEILQSCALDWIPLKGKISDNDYNELVRIWNLNNNEKVS